jgi:uncharacterized protein
MSSASAVPAAPSPPRQEGATVRIGGGLLGERAACVRNVVIPYQWEALNDRVPGAERSGTVQNFQIAAGEREGKFHGYWFQDSDLAKWIEAASHRLRSHYDAALDRELDGLIATIAKAQRDDGYLDTYIQLVEPEKRWANLHEYHELYIAGHFIEAGVAHFEATGKRSLLEVVRRLADLLDRTFGRAEGKRRGYCGHEEVELALVKLGRATGEPRYIELAAYFVEERGSEPNYFEREIQQLGIEQLPPYFHGDRWAFLQAHQPVRDQKEPVGHAVRAMYLYTAMALLADERKDEALANACRRLWREVVTKHLYVTGAIGAEWMGEKFGTPYDLPNERAYAETCASIGLMLFARSMLSLELRGEYADVMERALYNNVLAGMSKDGTRFFYVNPLEVTPGTARRRYDCRHVKTQRVPWFGCACCPPNIARTLASLDRYAVTVQPDGIALHLYWNGTVDAQCRDGNVGLSLTTDYPWDGSVSIEVLSEGRFTLRLRLPGWCAEPGCTVNGKAMDVAKAVDGYLVITRNWSRGDRVELAFPMPVERVRAHPEVAHAAGSVAIMRGPLVYCAEQADNGANLSALSLPATAQFSARFDPALESVVLEGPAVRDIPARSALYSTAEPSREPARLRLVPYFRWANRGEGEMRVWLRAS